MKIQGGFPGEGRQGNGPGPAEVLRGRIERVISPGVYALGLEDGRSVVVRAEAGYPVGKSLKLDRSSWADQVGPTMDLSSDGRSGVPLRALIPLAFGGEGALADLSVFVEKDPWLPSGERAGVYLVFTVRTELQGELQWTVYLKGKGISLQVFGDRKRDIQDRITEVEENLQEKGYFLLSPTVLLRKRFRMPDGYRLDLRG